MFFLCKVDTETMLMFQIIFLNYNLKEILKIDYL